LVKYFTDPILWVTAKKQKGKFLGGKSPQQKFYLWNLGTL